MKKNIINIYFFDLIKVVTENNACLSGIPTSEEWNEIYLLAKRHTLIGVVFGAIDKLPKEQRPPRPRRLRKAR